MQRLSFLLASALALIPAVAPAAPPPPSTFASPVPAPTFSGSPAPVPVVSPLTDAQLKDPAAALAALRKTLGANTWGEIGAIYVTGIAQVQNQSLPFTYAVDMRTGYNRMIVLLPHNAGTYEYGIDRSGGWSAMSGYLHPFDASAAAVKTSLYVNRFGFLAYPNDPASLKEDGLDAKLGDRISVTPSGGSQALLLLKPSTSLLSAVQFANGQVSVYADYRRVGPLLYPYRMMQGTNPQNLSVFQAVKVEFTKTAPEAAAVTRPALPVQKAAAAKPAAKSTHHP